MQKYQIPHTDLQVSRLGYGCMGLGGHWNTEPLDPADQAKAVEVVEKVLSEGINFFDHADIYMMGKAEEAFSGIWKTLGTAREDVVLQSKCAIRFQDMPNPGDPQRFDFSYDYIVSSTENILRRLNTDYLDILLLHRPDPLIEPEEVARAFDALASSGKVRHFGVSNHTASQMAFLQYYLDQPIVVNQVEMNVIHSSLVNDGVTFNRGEAQPKSSEGTVEYCRMNGVLLQAYSPVAGGRLFGTPDEMPAGYLQETARIVSEMAEAKQTSKEAILLAWLLRHPAGIQPIFGTTRPERIAASVMADDITLSREDWYRLFIAGRGEPLP